VKATIKHCASRSELKNFWYFLACGDTVPFDKHKEKSALCHKASPDTCINETNTG
jgi:hypothetical protein